MNPSRSSQPSASMYWLILLIAGLFEVCWAVGLKYSEGFTNFRWTVFTVLTLVASMSLLALALRGLPLGTAYAVWTGIGAVGTATLGIVLFGEPRAPLRLLFIAIILVGIIGLKLVSGDGEDEKAPRQTAAAPDPLSRTPIRPEPGTAPGRHSSRGTADS